MLSIVSSLASSVMPLYLLCLSVDELADGEGALRQAAGPVEEGQGGAGARVREAEEGATICECYGRRQCLHACMCVCMIVETSEQAVVMLVMGCYDS